MTDTLPPVAGVPVDDFRCWRCGRLLAERAGPGTAIKCSRCGARSLVPTAADSPPDDAPKRTRRRASSA